MEFPNINRTPSNKQVCEHGIPSLEFCEQCFSSSKKNTPYWDIITKLQDTDLLDKSAHRSPLDYRFVVPPALDTNGRFQNQSFSVQQIRDPNDSRLGDVLNFLSNNFDPHVLNDPDGFKRKLTGVTQYNTERPPYRCFYVTNEKSDIIGVRVAEQIPLITKDGIESNKNIFYAMYIVMDPKYRGGNNIPVEMYVDSLMDAAEMSQKNNTQVEYLIAECSSLTEKLQNKIGLKRIYLKIKDDEIKEIEFFQPAMNFDPETGEPTSAESAEHFMLYKTNQSLLTKEDVYNAISSLMYQYKSNHPRIYFKNDEAFNKHEMYFNQKLDHIKNQLDGCEEVIQLAKNERNVGVIGFDQADKEY